MLITIPTSTSTFSHLDHFFGFITSYKDKIYVCVWCKFIHVYYYYYFTYLLYTFILFVIYVDTCVILYNSMCIITYECVWYFINAHVGICICLTVYVCGRIYMYTWYVSVYLEKRCFWCKWDSDDIIMSECWNRLSYRSFRG